MTLDLSGVHPAHLVPFDESGEAILEDPLCDHLRSLDRMDGIDAMVTNGHGAEVFALSPDERVRLVEIVDDTIAPTSPVISGLVAGSTAEATREAGRLAEAGADALLVFPPHTTINHRREAAVGYIEAVGDAVDIPLVLFQHPVWGGGTYDSDLLVELASLDPVIGVKNACWEMDRFQDDVFALQEADVDTQLLVANDEHLLASYAVRTDGTILILAAVIPELIIELHEAVQAGDLETARRAYQQADPLIRQAFGDPTADSTPRLKKMLELQGTFPNAVPRPPAVPVEESEIPAIKRVMERAGLSVAPPTA